MLYYKVPGYMDNKTLYKTKNGKRYSTGYFLIKDELLTAKECKKIGAPINKLIPVTIKKTCVYRLFGARFIAED